MKVLFNDLRWALACQVFMLLVMSSNFASGCVPPTSSGQLIDLCTPPSRHKGGRAKGPTRDQMRYVIEQLVEHGLVKRDASSNESKGALILTVRKRKLQTKK